MIKFYQSVDLRSRKAMTRFLTGHFRYYTMNPWNLSKSYACNLKIYNLGLDREITNKLYDMLQTNEFYEKMHELMYDFGAEHNYVWQAGMNGRSGGYLVLYQGGAKPSQWRSYCTNCGQRNFTSVTKTGTVCGKCGQSARQDFTKPPMDIFTLPGQGTDDGEDFEDWDIDTLRERVRLVQEFDRLADDMVRRAVELAKSCTVVDEEYLVPQSRKVMVAV